MAVPIADREFWAYSIVSSKKRLRGRSQVKAADLQSAITKIRFQDTMKGSSTMTVSIKDQGWDFVDSGFFDADADGRVDPIDVNYPEGSEQWWRLTQVGVDAVRGGASLTMTFMERPAVYLMRHRGPLKVTRAKRTRAEFLKMLNDQVKAGGGITFHSVELHEKQEQAGLTAAEKKAAAKSEKERRKDKDKGISRSEKITFKNWDGRDYTLKPGELRNAERVLDEAVDHTNRPNPLLALLCACIVEAPFFRNPMGGDSSSVGILQLLDLFGSVSKRRDIAWVVGQFLNVGFARYSGAIKTEREHPDFTPGQIAQWVQGSAYPDRYDKVLDGAQKVLDAYGGTGSGGREYRKQYNFEVGSPDNPYEDFWAATNRLAEQVKWAYFLDGNDAYFDAEPTFIQQKPVAVVRRNDPAVIRLSSNWDERQIATEATLELVCNPFDFRAGEVFKLEGFGPASSGSTAKRPGYWLVGESDRALDSLATVFTLKQPEDPAPEPRSQTAQTRDKGGEATPGGSGSRGKVVVADGADRAGVKTRRHVFAFLELVAGRLDKTIYVTTGSNHSQLSASGLVSDHWAGDAGDLGSVRNQFQDGGKGGDDIAQACAEVLGISKAATTGTYDRHVWRYATKTYSVQVLWKVEGHYNHVHVGVRPA